MRRNAHGADREIVAIAVERANLEVGARLNRHAELGRQGELRSAVLDLRRVDFELVHIQAPRLLTALEPDGMHAGRQIAHVQFRGIAEIVPRPGVHGGEARLDLPVDKHAQHGRTHIVGVADPHVGLGDRRGQVDVVDGHGVAELHVNALAAHGTRALGVHGIARAGVVFTLPGQHGLPGPEHFRLRDQLEFVEVQSERAGPRDDADGVPAGQHVAQFDRGQHVEIVPPVRVHDMFLTLELAVHVDLHEVARIVAVVSAVVVGIADDDLRVRPAAVEIHVIGRLPAVDAHGDGLAAAARRAKGKGVVAPRVERLRLPDEERLDRVHDLDVELRAVGVVVGGHFLEELPPRAVHRVPVPRHREHAAGVLGPVDVRLAVVDPHRSEPRERIRQGAVADVRDVDNVLLAVHPQVHVAGPAVVILDVHGDVLRVDRDGLDAGERPVALHGRPDDDRRSKRRPIHTGGRMREETGVSVFVQNEDLGVAHLVRVRHALDDPEILRIVDRALRRDHLQSLRSAPPEVHPDGMDDDIAVVVHHEIARLGLILRHVLVHQGPRFPGLVALPQFQHVVVAARARRGLAALRRGHNLQPQAVRVHLRRPEEVGRVPLPHGVCGVKHLVAHDAPRGPVADHQADLQRPRHLPHPYGQPRADLRFQVDVADFLG